MPIKFSPYTGMILRCDFTGFRVPEMVKSRPVVVISPRPERANKGTCIIAALSTTAPEPIHHFHAKITLPGKIPEHLGRECWIKGDMIYSVAYSRLDLYRMGRGDTGKRQNYFERVNKDDLKRIRR